MSEPLKSRFLEGIFDDLKAFFESFLKDDEGICNCEPCRLGRLINTKFKEFEELQARAKSRAEKLVDKFCNYTSPFHGPCLLPKGHLGPHSDKAK